MLAYFSLGLFSFSAFLLFLRAFYAMKDTSTPALINAGAVVVNVGANLLLFPVLGVRGLALGHAIAYTVRRGHRRGGPSPTLARAGGAQRASRDGPDLLAAGATAAAAWGAARVLGNTLGTATLLEQVIQVGGAVLFGLVTFVAAALVLRIEEFDLVKRTLLGRLRR